jgi:hypothetical protein
MRNYIVLMLLYALVGCQNIGPSPAMDYITYPVKPYALNRDDAAAIEFWVRHELKDPLSAMFGEARATIDAKGTIYVCGIINARNSFGGYTGFVPYHGLLMNNKDNKRVFAMIGMGGSPGDIPSQTTAIMCQKYGIV